MPKMYYCTGDTLALIVEISQRRIALVCGQMAKRNGGDLELAESEVHELKWVRMLHHRMMRGDYRLELNEWERLRDLANWLIRKHAEINGHPEPKPFQYDANGLWQSEPLPAGTYQKLSEALVAGEFDGETGVI